ncbi:nuclease [Prochlorococcus marinus str. MU1404]|nr:thermonuclease family protein [Prochlorococcus marinus XMU1404]MBW3072650.1 nuclease [Prochlorococcus marinus str. MU1404]
MVKIKNCYDGDTCTTESGEKIRLACIDAPELQGKNADPLKAKASKEFINNLLSNKKVTIKRIDTDRYGRTIAEIFLEGTNIQKLMVKNGFAKIYRKYSFQCDWAT